MIPAPISAALRGLGICCCLLGLGTIDALASEPEWRAWAMAARAQHALAGQLYDARNGRLTDLREETVSLLPGGSMRLDGGSAWFLPEGIVLLGEVHDNPAHHRLRAWLIEQTARLRLQWRPGIVFEHIRADQQPALDRFEALKAEGKGTADSLLGLLEWDKSGWPPAATFKPLFEAAVRLPILAGNTPRDRIKDVARQGLPALADEERSRLRLDEVLPNPLADALRRELEESHCGALPPQAMGGMAAAQRYRDAHMADVLLTAAQRHGSAILIAGNGHVRADRGVPWHLSRRAPATPVTTVLLLEVEDGKTEPADYVPRDPNGRAAADFIVFTPRAERADPCEALRKK